MSTGHAVPAYDLSDVSPGLVIAGLEVPHMHVHVFPAWSLEDFSFARAKPASDEELDQAAARLRAVVGTGL